MVGQRHFRRENQGGFAFPLGQNDQSLAKDHGLAPARAMGRDDRVLGIAAEEGDGAGAFPGHLGRQGVVGLQDARAPRCNDVDHRAFHPRELLDGLDVVQAEVVPLADIGHDPDVAEVAVVGVEDPEWGERVRAFVVAKPGTSLDEGGLRLWTRERLAGPKVPRDFVLIDALPRNPTGKVLKRDYFR